MKNLIAFLLSITSVTAFAVAKPMDTQVTCRNYDYHNLGGDRKVVEVRVHKVKKDPVFNVTISNLRENLQADKVTYVETSRLVAYELTDVTCLQDSDDPLLLTCAKQGKQLQYFNIALQERKTMLSAISTTPGRIAIYRNFGLHLYDGAYQFEQEFSECGFAF